MPGATGDILQLTVLTGEVLLDVLRGREGRRGAVPPKEREQGTAFLVGLSFQEAVERTGSLQELVVRHGAIR